MGYFHFSSPGQLCVLFAQLMTPLKLKKFQLGGLNFLT